jgi:hypothetical protein
MKSHRDEIDLSAELRALRPAPRPEFTTALDSRADSGFPKASRRPSSGVRRIAKLRPAFGRILELLRAVTRRRLLAPAGAAAVAAIVVATALIVTTEDEPSGGTADVSAPQFKEAGSGSDARSTQFSAPAPTSAAGNAAAGRAKAAQGTSDRLSGAGPYASRAAHRDVERSAEIVLGTDASDVRSAAANVFETVHAYDGIVLRSSISDGSKGEAGATFNLLIPSGKLSDAMAAFSGIAELRSRHESTVDVTAPTIGLGERLQDARAKVDGLLAEVAGAETEAGREAAEAKLRSARRRVAALRARLTNLRRHTHLSAVWLRIETGAVAAGGNSGSWGVDDALGDASHILTVAAGVSLVGLAILVPPTLIGLLAWLAHRGWVCRRRERSLD